MELSQRTVLVTGGASGIGLAIAERFLRAGSEVVVCGRREDRLREARDRHPALRTRVADVASETDRAELFDWATREFPALDVLVNNAGIQRRFRLAEPEPWSETRQEIAINLEAPVHLTQLFLPQLLRQPRAAIVNVTSGLAFVPMAIAPVYCATKAALHSFTLSLRHQLAGTPVEVIEVIPPAVNTDLGGPGLHTFGAPLDEFADSVMERMGRGDLEIPYGTSERSSRASRAELDEIFARMNAPR
ncbi:MAG TPA: SDR family NAD(P)-dependent oxidoreductase [Longimicrobiaceae bacterium]|jgi:uncharacterized oxidoreductase